MTASDQARTLATVAARAADDKLASDVVVLDVSEQLVLTEAFVIASASNERQVNAIVEEVEDKLREAGVKPTRREGAREGRWALLDFLDIVVHVFHEEEREYYALEKLWKDCPRIEVEGLGEHAPTDGSAGTDGDREDA
ncbi:ribosome silencing factor [Tsukamurella asaccharolytica]|uniref:Ribosomal silencing factor RsfS n=1 Tax=Tsukamurella asaccharolytica TaxID=2592067 RepID=A0A5C5RA15_9ACTN|nr:ribosome silencing factor [Tsukamurella asaccharolytica]TWS19512.1 ribosome silencing factor [Tsukamurella asaccharolytica]